MSIHLTIWWLWWTLIVVYGFGVLVGMAMTLVVDDLEWWLRPVVLVWPLALAALFIWHLGLFMIGRE